jgi:hypothetical protein
MSSSVSKDTIGAAEGMRSGPYLRRGIRWLIGAIQFYSIIFGALYGLVAPRTPWWSWACIAIYAYQILRALPGRIRNGYWGYCPSTSAWEQMKAQEKLRR